MDQSERVTRALKHTHGKNNKPPKDPQIKQETKQRLHTGGAKCEGTKHCLFFLIYME